MRSIHLPLVSVLIVVLVCLASGCVAEGPVHRARADLAALRAEVPDGTPAAHALDRALAEADHALESGNADPIGRSLGAVLPFLPEPMRTPAVLGAGLAASLIRARQLKKAARSIAQGIDRALQEDPDFAERFRANAKTIQASQTPTARRVVDESTKADRMVRLPI